MQYFYHSTVAQNAQPLKDIENIYGLAGLGFYWKAVELLMISNTKIPINNFQKLRYTQIGQRACYDIIRNSGIFEIEDDYYVTLKKGVDNGISKASVNRYFRTLKKIYSMPDDARATSPAHESAGASALTIIDKDKKEKDDESRVKLENFINQRCPHLRDMEIPLTLEQYRLLNKKYFWNQIEQVLIDMENEVDLYRTKRSCYETARKWLECRYGKNKSSESSQKN